MAEAKFTVFCANREVYECVCVFFSILSASYVPGRAGERDGQRARERERENGRQRKSESLCMNHSFQFHITRESGCARNKQSSFKLSNI